MHSSFSELEYAAKKKVTRRDRFLAEIEAAAPWRVLERTIAPFYPNSDGRSGPPIGLSRMLADEGIYLVSESTFSRVLKVHRERAKAPKRRHPPTT